MFQKPDIHRSKENKVKKEHFIKTRQYNVKTFYKIIFFKSRTRQIKTTQINERVTDPN